MELTPQQLKAVELISVGTKRYVAAEKLGISRKTLWQWEQLPEFRAQLNDLLRESREDTISSLRKLSGTAVDVLGGILTDPDTPHSVLASTAFKILQLVGLDPTAFVLEQLGSSEADFTPERLKLIRERIYGIYETGSSD